MSHLVQPSLCCLLLFHVCHLYVMSTQHLSSNWRVRAKIERPYMVNKKQKGVVVVQRGNQSIQYHSVLPKPVQGSCQQYSSCSNCDSPEHVVQRCPIYRCPTCGTYGHDRSVCGTKK